MFRYNMRERTIVAWNIMASTLTIHLSRIHSHSTWGLAGNTIFPLALRRFTSAPLAPTKPADQRRRSTMADRPRSPSLEAQRSLPAYLKARVQGDRDRDYRDMVESHSIPRQERPRSDDSA